MCLLVRTIAVDLALAEDEGIGEGRVSRGDVDRAAGGEAEGRGG